MSIVNVFIVLCLFLTFGYFIGLLTFITDYEENKCEMTYMFQYPQFVRILTKYDDQFIKYGLYTYNEGHLTEKSRNMKFDGIPILYIPGNAGSYKQVRSLASVALRKALNSRPGFHFDYFTVDLNNEFSGLNGALLYEQSRYVNLSIKRILQLYENNKHQPKSLILIGHSMGGIIARNVLFSEVKHLVSLVVTLSSPHLRPPVILDRYMKSFYENIKNISSDLFILNLSGGFNDFLVPPYLTISTNGLDVITSAIPKVWLPVDHLCILWCKQLILALNRALFDSIDVKTKQIDLDRDFVEQIFRHHLINNSGIQARYFKQYNNELVSIDNRGDWIEPLNRQYTFKFPENIKYPKWYMIRFLNQPKHEFLTAVAVNLEQTNWVYACTASYVRNQSRICINGINLSHKSEISPTAQYKRRTLRINMHELKKNNSELSHVIIKLLPSEKPVTLHVDVHNKRDRRITVNLPKLWIFSKRNIMRETADKSIEYELILPQLQHLMQVYQLYVEPFNCINENHHATASLIVPWGHQTIHQFFTSANNKPFNLRLYNSKPNNFANSSAVVRLTLDPICKYQISIRSSWLGILGQMARYYTPLLYANLAAVILMTLRSQLKTINEKEKCPLFFIAMKEGSKPYYVLTSIKIISKLLGTGHFSKYVPLPDWILLAEEGLDFLLLPLLLYMCSVGIVWILAVGLSMVILLYEATAHRFITKCLSMTLTGAAARAEWLMSGFEKLPAIAAVLLIFITFSTCGGLALGLGAIFYFFKLTKMSQDFVESFMWRMLKHFAKKIRVIFKQEIAKRNTASTNENTTNVKTELNAKTEAGESSKKSENNEESKNSTEETKSELVDSNEEKPLETDQNSNNNTWLKNILENNEIFFHFTIFFLWITISALNIPIVLTWAHNYKYSKVLQPDPSFFSGLSLSICALPLWQFDLPKTQKYFYKELSELIFLVVVVILIYCPISLYRLNYLLTITLILIVLHQLIAPNKRERTENISTEDDEKIDSILEGFKAKLD